MTRISCHANFKTEIELVENTHFQLVQNMPRDGVRGVRGLQSNSFYYRNIKTWNNLPKGVVDAKDINNFKQILDEAWKDKPTKYNHIRSNDSLLPVNCNPV